MKDTLWEISCGITHIILMFLGVYFSLIFIDSMSFTQKLLTETTAYEKFCFVFLLIGLFFWLIVLIVLSAFLWSRLLTKHLDKEYRGYILHRLYKTPASGWFRDQNIKYINWVLGST